VVDRTELQASGLWAWLESEPDSRRGRTVRRLAKIASQRAWEEFVAGRLPKDSDGGLKMRFSPRAWDALTLTARGAKYERYKEKRMGGRNLPYTSPNAGSHMRDMLGIKGPGFQLRNLREEGGTVTTQLTLPGARILNRIRKPKGAIYRSEFLQLAGRAKHQADAIVARALEILIELLREHLAKQPKRKVKVQPA
jgi:hypothetical protein